jgi:hypothetical protein
MNWYDPLNECDQLEETNDRGEDIANGWSHNRQDGDHDDRDQNQDQRVLGQALPFLK